MISQHHPVIGSWRIELYPDEQSSVNHALVAFCPDGVLIASPPPVEPFPPAEEGAVNVATGLGAWQANGDDEVELGFVAQATDSKGNLLGFGSVHATGRFDDETGTISGRYHFEEAGPDESVFATEDGWRSRHSHFGLVARAVSLPANRGGRLLKRVQPTLDFAADLPADLLVELLAMFQHPHAPGPPERSSPMQSIETLIIGAGQAGLATSYWLQQAGREHLVLEQADRAADVWQSGRWDSFSLVTPNWTFRLPGAEYDGPDPDGFMPLSEIRDSIRALRRALSNAGADPNAGAVHRVRWRRRLPRRNLEWRPSRQKCGHCHRMGATSPRSQKRRAIFPPM